MNSSTEDPYPPAMAGGVDETQIFDADMSGAALDNSAFFDSAYSADPATSLLDDGGFYNSNIPSPFSSKENSIESDARYGDFIAGQSTSPESSSQDSSSDSSGHRKRKSSSRSSHSPENLAMSGVPQAKARLANTTPGQANLVSGPSWQSADQQMSFEPAHRGNAEQDLDMDSAASSPDLPNPAPRHVAIPVQYSPSNASMSPFIQTAQQATVSS